MHLPKDQRLILPIDSSLEQIRAAFLSSQNLVITASPGSGKTTRVPPAVLSWTERQVLVLEPRRVAALAAATRIAEENDWKLGEEVGYQVRFENRTSSRTRLKFLTETLLARQMIFDPELKDVEVVILDEFHERSAPVDLALGLLRELQMMGHPIRLIVMSASMESQKISAFLGGAPIIDVPGKLHELSVTYDSKSQILRLHPDFFVHVSERVKEYQKKTKRDLLVFLPGVGEINRVETLLKPWAELNNITLNTLFAQKPLSEQREIIQRSQFETNSQQRVILSTNLAESALTIDGVGLVIDSGLEKRVEFDERSESERISLQRISKASALQRAGRAARQFPGHVVKLWTKSDELSFPAQIPAEILKSDLSSALLFLSAQGVHNFNDFSWYEKPPARNLAWAEQELISLGALDANRRITSLGKMMLQFPVPPRLGKLLVLAQQENIFPLACDLVALLQEKDILHQIPPHAEDQEFESDLLERWSLWHEGSPYLHRRNCEQVEKASKSLQALCQRPQAKQASPRSSLKEDLLIMQKLLAMTFADRICRRRTPGSERGIKRGGRGVVLEKESVVRKSEFFIPLKSLERESQNMKQNIKETSVHWASGISLNQLQTWMPDSFSKQSRVIYVSDRQRVIRQTQNFFADLPLDEGTITEASGEEMREHFPSVIRSYWPQLIEKNLLLARWFGRYNVFVQSAESERFAWRFDEALLLLLGEELALGLNELDALETFDIPGLIERHLPEDLKAYWAREWPLHWQAPNGRWVPVHYQPGKKPYVEIKIQEVFGIKKNPLLFGDQSPLVFHLLAPSQRPVQITADLVGFWKGSYLEVRKELKPRYPKHSWPDDPMNEAPELPRQRFRT